MNNFQKNLIRWASYSFLLLLFALLARDIHKAWVAAAAVFAWMIFDFLVCLYLRVTKKTIKIGKLVLKYG